MRIVSYEDRAFPWVVARETPNEWADGCLTLRLFRPPQRFWSDQTHAPVAMYDNVDSTVAGEIPSPSQLLAGLPAHENWPALTTRTLAAMHAWFLAAEDPHERLLARDITPLAHQISLVKHILETPNLQNVLIADEVGLGKTIEAGLLIHDLLAKDPSLRILYLAPARLVHNVVRELRKLDMRFRPWSAESEERADLADSLIVASIHRAAHKSHFESFVKAGPFDVLVVDECHHLSDWGKGGGKPTKKYRLVEELKRQMPNDGRLVLMSGTPHQGHADRFHNVLRLLKRGGESDEEVRGRVIYRTKEDVTDWHGQPLFPRRRVNEPKVVVLTEAHRKWLSDIHRLFTDDASIENSDARARAVGWRAGQAMQWASSSVQAGLGYLVRQGIRADWTLESPGMAAAIEHLRPYRGGPRDEPLPALYDRMYRQVRDRSTETLVDEEDGFGDDSPDWRPDPERLATALQRGVALLGDNPDFKWDLVWDEILEPAGDERVVLFAQPIETVTTLSHYLEQKTGVAPALIIGSQSARERDLEVERFHSSGGPRFLIASKAGTEGFNLQIARRLVHLDIPWNPMELEQRIGRVHRFMSKREVIVDTLVVQDSREEDAYRIARGKLEAICKTFKYDQDSVDMLFSRVMSLVPPASLHTVLAGGAGGPLEPEGAEKVQAIVAAGFEDYQRFEEEFKENRKALEQPRPGEATWADLAAFVRQHSGASSVDGYTAMGFRWDKEEIVEAGQPAEVLQIGAQRFACGDYGGMPVTKEGEANADLLGVNRAQVTSKLREAAFPSRLVGAGIVRIAPGTPLPSKCPPGDFLVMTWCRMTRRQERGAYREIACRLHTFIRDATEQDFVHLDDAEQGDLVRALVGADPLRAAPEWSLTPMSEAAREDMRARICRPTEEETRERTAHCAYPVAAIVVRRK